MANYFNNHYYYLTSCHEKKTTKMTHINLRLMSKKRNYIIKYNKKNIDLKNQHF